MTVSKSTLPAGQKVLSLLLQSQNVPFIFIYQEVTRTYPPGEEQDDLISLLEFSIHYFPSCQARGFISLIKMQSDLKSINYLSGTSFSSLLLHVTLSVGGGSVSPPLVSGLLGDVSVRGL